MQTYDASNAFRHVWTFIRNVIIYYFDMHSRIKIFGNFSMLDFDIALVVFGIIFSVVFNVIRSGVNNSMSSVDKHREELRRDQKYANRRAARGKK